MKQQEKMWVVLTHAHTVTGDEHISWESMRYKRTDAIAAFIDGTGMSWREWRKLFNFRCERVLATLEQPI